MTTDLEMEPLHNGHDENVTIMPDDGASTVDGAAGTATNGTQLVPVSEAKKYRKRAQAAEKKIVEMQEQLTSARQALMDRDQELKELKRSHAINAALQEHGAIDPE